MQLIYIVEDDENIREIESYALSGSGFKTVCFENARSFYEALLTKLPDLVLLDIMLPDEDGMTILQKIRKSPLTKELPVIMVTAKSSEIDAVKGLDGGADDYITKPFGIMELISRVKAILRRTGTRPLGEPITYGDIYLDPDKRLCKANGKAIDLTYKEYELLQYLMVNAGIVLKRDVLMDRIWGIDYDGESRTLDAHIKSLRKKLGEEGKYIQTIRNVGYMVS